MHRHQFLSPLQKASEPQRPQRIHRGNPFLFFVIFVFFVVNRTFLQQGHF